MKSIQLIFALLICSFASIAQKTGDTSLNNKSNDELFVMKASRVGMKEVAMCTEATTKASSERVKNNGNMLVRDHTDANEELKGIAEKNNIKLTPGRTEMEKADKNKADWDKTNKNKDGMDMHSLSTKSGAEYDKEYLQIMVTDHSKAIELFKMESQNGKNADLKAFATKMLPTLQMHLDSAIAVQSSIIEF